jgi:hypothetical protein
VSFDFEPVTVAPRRRRIDLMPIGVLGVLLALLAAVAKPWQAGGIAEARPPGQVGAAASPSRPGTSPASAAPVATTGGDVADLRVARTPTWRDLEPAIKSHDSWGVRAIFLARRGLQPDPRVRYMEGWTSTTPRPHGLETTSVARDDRSIVALGITYPSGSAPQEVRISRLNANDQIESIDARPLDAGHAGGAFLFLRFGVGGIGFQTWEAGRYRIDMLGVDGPRWIRVEIPERRGPLDEPAAWFDTLPGPPGRGCCAGRSGTNTAGRRWTS